MKKNNVNSIVLYGLKEDAITDITWQTTNKQMIVGHLYLISHVLLDINVSKDIIDLVKKINHNQ